MATAPLILAIDQGTTSSRCIAFAHHQRIVASAQQEFAQHFPADGWVEHDPADIWQTTIATCREVIDQVGAKNSIAGIGITNQRETTLVWDRHTGEPVYRAIVWQDRRTADLCQQLRQQGHGKMVAEKTGLLLDPYFSGTKIRWILDNVEGARRRAEAGDLLFGTVDCFLIWKLTGGKHHLTDATNASRTLLYNIHSGDWDAELLALLEIPASLLPRIQNCADDYGVTDAELLGLRLPLAGVAGDQQAALFGQCCFQPGMTKSTYGTGCFMVMNTGPQPVRSHHQLLTTIGYQLQGQRTYALEGAIFNAGTTVQWLRDQLGLIPSTAVVEDLIAETDGNRGVYLVPAFTGLGAPHWNAEARGILTGLTRDTGRAQLVRAAVESVCYQSRDLLEAMTRDSGIALEQLRVDGGMTANHWMLQFLADMLDTRVCKPAISESTALGAANLAGLQLGLIADLPSLTEQWQAEQQFQPRMAEAERNQLTTGWQTAVRQCLG